MRVRLGYVAITKALENITSSSMVTFTNYEKGNSNLDDIDRVIKSNLEDLMEILKYNIKNNIHFYRISSKLIPLATHEKVEFDYIDKYKEYYNKISLLINNNYMRVDMHPDQFAVLNSTKKEVINNTINILKYQYKILDAFEVKDKVIILHIGSSVFGKQSSIKRFINVFNQLPDYLKNTIVIENDDKIYNILDTLTLSETLNIPFVLDYHHHLCNGDNLNIDDYLLRIFNTWKIIPKIHFSSPKNHSKKDFRSHSEYIDYNEFIKFINILKKYDKDIDIMLEAKGKDEALFRLVRQLKYATDYKFIDDTTFIV